MSGDRVEQLCPRLIELTRMLDDLDGKVVTIRMRQEERQYAIDAIDAIHQGLLRKKRQTGDLKLT